MSFFSLLTMFRLSSGTFWVGFHEGGDCWGPFLGDFPGVSPGGLLYLQAL